MIATVVWFQVGKSYRASQLRFCLWDIINCSDTFNCYLLICLSR